MPSTTYGITWTLNPTIAGRHSHKWTNICSDSLFETKDQTNQQKEGLCHQRIQTSFYLKENDT